MNEAIVVQRPAAASASPAELLLLFHGVGSSAEDLVPLGRTLAAQRPGAWIVSVRSPDPSDLGSGWQWFSVQGITEANRPGRVDAALPAFLRAVASWQHETGVAPDATTLIGFSQGAIMALEATQAGASPAGRVISIAGRFAQTPRIAPAHARLHLLHGELDHVMPIGLSVDAQARLQLLGAASTLDRFPGLGHGIDARVVECILRRLAPDSCGAKMNKFGTTRLRLDSQRTTLSAPAEAEVIVAAGVDRLAEAIFRHDPPTPAEMEQAIDIVEDALMAAHMPHAERGELVTSDPLLQTLPGLRDEGARLTRDDVEALFQQLASATLGNPGALRSLPAGGRAAAALLILRECVHHLGYEAVRINAREMTSGLR